VSLYRRILVPLGDAGDAAILEHVGQLAELTGAEIVLLRVAHYHTRDSRTAEVAESEMLLGEVAPRLLSKGLQVRTVVGQGEVAETILTQAEALECDLIALATHGHGLLKRGVLGCVSEAIRRGSPIPVLTVRISRSETRVVGTSPGRIT
jgi:nucleotide-binding universal stress UspA family protein